MGTVTVYRYEHPVSGLGPYHQDWSYHSELSSAHSNYRYPSSMDLLTSRDWSQSSRFFAGVVSRKQLTKWFHRFNTRLVKDGFIVKKYQVPEKDVRGPDKHGQVAFLRG